MVTFHRVTYSGALASSEVFAFGWAFTDAANGDSAAQVTACTQWLTDFLDTVTGGSSAKARFRTDVTWNKIRVASYFGGNVTNSTEAAVSRAGTAASAGMPYEVAIAVSLNCGAVTEGPKRGRFYLPCPVTGFMDNGLGTFVITGGLDAIIGGVNAAFDTFNTADRKVGVMRNVVNSTTFVNDAITVGVGNVPDSQRRRRNKQIEVRSSHTIV